MNQHLSKVIITNLITLIGLICSSWAVFQLAYQGPYVVVLGFACLGFIADILDGFLARHWQTETKLGGVLDLAHDLILYVLLVVVVLERIFSPSIWISLALVVFTLSSTLRLVRFWQVGLVHDGKDTYYQGMPVYANLFGLVFILHLHSLVLLPSLFVAGLLVISSGLMISQLKVYKPNLHQSILAAITLIALVIAL